MESPSQYRDQLFRETERMYKRKTGTDISIDRNTLEKVGRANGFEFRVRSKGGVVRVAHNIKDNWTLERNAWEIGNKIHRKYQGDRVH